MIGAQTVKAALDVREATDASGSNCVMQIAKVTKITSSVDDAQLKTRNTLYLSINNNTTA